MGNFFNLPADLQHSWICFQIIQNPIHSTEMGFVENFNIWLRKTKINFFYNKMLYLLLCIWVENFKLSFTSNLLLIGNLLNIDRFT
jgi:hypothetical protein